MQAPKKQSSILRGPTMMLKHLDLHEAPSDWRQTRTQQGIFLAFQELSLNLYTQIPPKIACTDFSIPKVFTGTVILRNKFGVWFVVFITFVCFKSCFETSTTKEKLFIRGWSFNGLLVLYGMDEDCVAQKSLTR